MAQIISEQIVIQIHKLVKSEHAAQSVLDAHKLQMLLETLPGIVEQLLEDSQLLVEVNVIQE